MSCAALQPILHLASLNPHVASTIPRPGAFFMPRQPAASASSAAASAAYDAPAAVVAAAWGVSAFAFQGTNAHALLALGGGGGAPPAGASNPRLAVWARERFWVGPEPHPLAGRVALVAAGSAAALFEADLLQPKHGYLWDHDVAGRPILPGAAFLEAAAACLHLAASTASDGAALLLAAASIPAPLELPVTAGSSGRLLLQCQLDVAAGRVRLATSGAGGRTREHLVASAAAAVRSAAPAAPQPAAPALLLLLATMLHAQQLQQGRQPANVGSIEAPRQDGSGGKAVDPACLDASFHLGALPAGASPATPQLRVPAGIGSYQVQAGTGASLQLAGGCQPVARSGATVTNDYWLAPGSGGSSLCRVSGLEARPLGRAAAAPAAPAMAAEASSSSSGMLYELGWVAAGVPSSSAAVAPAAATTARISLRQANELQLVSAGAGVLQRSTSGALLSSAGGQVAAAAAPVPAASAAAAIAAGMLQGLLKAAAQENSSGRFAAVDSDSLSIGARTSSALSLGAAAAAASAVDVHGAALRAGATFRPMLLPAGSGSSGGVSGQQLGWEGATAITGGTGTLGQLVAAFLASSGSGSSGPLSLLGRSGRLASSDEAAALVGSGSPGLLTIASCDAAAAEDAAAAVAATTGQRQLAALLHAGGVLADALLPNLTAAAISRALAPKVSSLGQLHAPLQLQPAAAQLLFSSVAALLGSPGQANYSAANAALDAAAAYEQQAGRPSTSVQWGAWAGAGMAAQDRSTALRVQRMGMAMIAPADGLAALRHLASAERAPPVVAGVPFLWDRLAAQQQQQGAAEPMLLAAMIASSTGTRSGSSVVSAPAAAAPAPAAAAAAGASQAAVLAGVLEVLRGILGADISVDEPLMAAGLDSLGAVELRNGLEAHFGTRLSGTLVFDYPTAAAMAAHIAGQLGASSAGGVSAGAAAAAAAAAAQSDRVAAEVMAAVAEILGTPAVDPAQPLLAAGLDSLGAVELRNSLEGRLGLALPTTLVFDYPTPAALSAYIASRLQPAAASGASGAAAALDLIAAGPSALALDGALAGPQPLAVAALATRSPKVRSLWLCSWCVAMQAAWSSLCWPYVSLMYLLPCPAPRPAPQGALRASLAPVDATTAVPLERWDLGEEEAALGGAPIRCATWLPALCHGRRSLVACPAAAASQAPRLASTAPAACMPGTRSATFLRLLYPCSLHHASGSPSSWMGWTSSTPPPLPSARTRRRSWTRSSACCWRRRARRCWAAAPSAPAPQRRRRRWPARACLWA